MPTARRRFWLKFSVALRPQRPHGLSGTGSPARTATSTFTQLLSSERAFQCCFTSAETIRTAPVQCCFTSTETIRDGEPRTSTSTFTQLLSSERDFQCCFTSTETIRTISDRMPRTATSTFTKLLSSVGGGLQVNRYTPTLQTQVYDIVPPVTPTAGYNYAIGLGKLLYKRTVFP